MNNLMNRTNAASSPAVTISSFELVEIINESRTSMMPVLRHDRFMVKVAKVLGEMCPELSGHYSA